LKELRWNESRGCDGRQMEKLDMATKKIKAERHNKNNY
jgi:hypothetical protein